MSLVSRIRPKFVQIFNEVFVELLEDFDKQIDYDGMRIGEYLLTPLNLDNIKLFSIEVFYICFMVIFYFRLPALESMIEPTFEEILDQVAN